MNAVSKSLIFAATAILGACSHYNQDLSMLDKSMKAQPAAVYAAAATPQDIAPAAGGIAAPTTTGSLGTYLAREYYDLARFENDKAFDYKAAKTYTEKAVAASKGQMTEPSRISSYDVPKEQMAELIEARQNLITALKTSNTPGNEIALAKAQTSFDCWLERSEEANNAGHYSSCKAEYEQSMAQLVMPAAGSEMAAPVATGSAIATTPAATLVAPSAPMTEVVFAPNSSAPDAMAEPSLAQIAAFLTAPQNAGYSAVITGFTNAAAPSPAGTQLATERALKVREILAAKGVADTFLKPQIASMPVGAIAPVSMSAVSASLENKVQIHLVGPARGLTTTSTTVVTTPATPELVMPPVTTAPAATAPIFKPSTTKVYN